MRVLVPRRFIRLGILLAVLCLTPALSPSAFAVPFGWVAVGDPNPPAPKGDGDGTVVKGVTLGNSATLGTAAIGNRTSVGTLVRTYIRLLRLGYGLRWFW